MYVTAILEFSVDPLTDPTPTWTAVTNVLLEAEWSGGIQAEGDDPTPGSARFTFHDNTRQFEPDYAAGSFYPNVVPGRRFRLRVTSSAVTYDEGIWYSQVFEPSWPDGATGQRSQVSCGDGMTILALDDLAGLDPPEADGYADVVAFDEPWGYWRLGEPEGTRATAIMRKVFRGKGKHRRKFKVRRGTRYETAGEAESGAGTAGQYRNTPQLGQPGLILGDTDTAVGFVSTGSEFVRIPVEQDTFVDRSRLTVECWAKFTVDQTMALVAGPVDTPSGPLPMFRIMRSSPSDVAFFGVLTGVASERSVVGTTALTVGETWHIVGTYDAVNVRLYVNGVLETEESSAGGPIQCDASEYIYVGQGGSSASFADAVIDEVAVYEHVLSPERILAHYQAGAERGYPQQTAGERIAALADSTLWAETSIQTAGREILPVPHNGQGKLDEIAEAAHAEGPRTMFFFGGTGDPVYLGHEWQATAARYNTVQATFGNTTGEVPFENVELVSDDETFNAVLASHESGEAVEVTSGELPQRVNSEWTDVLLVEHNEVESLAGHVLDFYKTAQFRPYRIDLSGVDTAARLQILQRQPGDLIRVKHRPRGTGTIIDRVCNIIGYEKRLDAETGHLSCTWYLGRGYNAGVSGWRAGVVGASEAGVTTTAG